MRLYEPGAAGAAAHPRVEETLTAAEAELRAAQDWAAAAGEGATLEFAVEGSRIYLRDVSGGRAASPALADPRGELAALAAELKRAEVDSLTLLPGVHIGELAALAGLLARPGESAHRGPWARRLEAAEVAAIRVNVPAGQPAAEHVVPALVAAAVLPELPALVATALAARADGPGAGENLYDPALVPAGDAECVAVIRLLGRLSAALACAPQGDAVRAAQAMARSLAETISLAERRTALLLAAAAARHEAHPGESAGDYFERVSRAVLLGSLLARLRGGGGYTARAARQSLERVAAELAAVERATRPAGAVDARWSDENYVACLHEMLWVQLSARERAATLRAGEGWCIPPAVLGQALRSMRPEEARAALAAYMKCLALADASARRATAAGLAELVPRIGEVWPEALPAGLAAAAARALVAERAPEVCALLAGAVEGLAGLALERDDLESFEGVLAELERGRGDGTAAEVRRRLLRDDRWQGLVDRALGRGGPRGSAGSLLRILARDPERLADDLGARMLASPAAARAGDEEPAAQPAAGLAEMARLAEAMGEPLLGTLVTRLSDPRSQRAATAARLLLACAGGPARLLEALPRVLPGWDWNLQDLVVSELARQAGTEEAGGVSRREEIEPRRCAEKLLEALPHAHPLVAPMIIDQLGLLGISAAAPVLMRIAAGTAPQGGEAPQFRGDVFVRIKAIEALGRLGAREAADLLRTILRSRSGLTHVEPAGIRAAAEEALALIENLPSSARVRALRRAEVAASQAFAQPRRYLRVPLDTPLQARIAALSLPLASRPARAGGAPRSFGARVSTISLGGAFVQAAGLGVGQSVQVEIRAGLRRIQGTAVVRNATPEGSGVEFVQMSAADRERLRRLVSRLARG